MNITKIAYLGLSIALILHSTPTHASSEKGWGWRVPTLAIGCLVTGFVLGKTSLFDKKRQQAPTAPSAQQPKTNEIFTLPAQSITTVLNKQPATIFQFDCPGCKAHIVSTDANKLIDDIVFFSPYIIEKLTQNKINSTLGQ